MIPPISPTMIVMISSYHQFPEFIKPVKPHQVKDDERQRRYRIIDAILHKRIGRGGQNLKRLVCRINVVTFQLMMNTPRANPVINAPMTFTPAQVFGAKTGHPHRRFSKTAVDRTEQDKPEQQQNLVLTEMQDKSWTGKRNDRLF